MARPVGGNTSAGGESRHEATTRFPAQGFASRMPFAPRVGILPHESTEAMIARPGDSRQAGWVVSGRREGGGGQGGEEDDDGWAGTRDGDMIAI